MQDFIHAVTPLLHQRLASQADSLIGMAAPSAAVRSGSMTVSIPSSSGASPGSDILSSSIGSSAVPDSSAQYLSPGRLTKLTSNRVNTDAMLQVLQQDIRQKGRRTSQMAGNELVVGELLGRGGYGCVYQGERPVGGGVHYWTNCFCSSCCCLHALFLGPWLMSSNPNHLYTNQQGGGTR